MLFLKESTIQSGLVRVNDMTAGQTNEPVDQ